MDALPPAPGSVLGASSEQLAKAWLAAIIERTPLDRVADVDLGLLATEAIPLIAGIRRGVEHGPHGAPDLPDDVSRRARELGRARRGSGASAEIQRDLAALQSLLIASLDRAAPLRPSGDVVGSARQLAEIFGSLHATVADGQVHEPDQAGPRRSDEPPVVPGSANLDGSLDGLVAEYRRYGHPFALALIELEGLREIYETRGRVSGDRMSTAATTMIRNQIRIVDHAFRVDDDAFCVLAPNVDAGKLRRMGDRLARVVDGSQADDGPRISISAGLSACPEHGHDSERLLEIAREALEAARAAGEPVEIGAFNGSRSVRES
ncbi:MAG: diguanylate cyclase domain-containing protein [Solirubrobacterales bacterium]